MFKIRAFFITTLTAGVRDDSLLAHGEHLHHRIISLREEFWAQTSSEVMYLCVRGRVFVC